MTSFTIYYVKNIINTIMSCAISSARPTGFTDMGVKLRMNAFERKQSINYAVEEKTNILF